MAVTSIGKKIRDQRTKLSLTQRDVANYVGVTEATVSRWESGEIDNMRRDKIAKLADILRVSPLLIMGISDKTPQPPAQPEDETRLIKLYRELSSNDKQIILEIAGRLNIDSQSRCANITATRNNVVQNNIGDNNYAAGGNINFSPSP